jgi:C-terminal processing protease CtpA/Prc
LGAVATAVATLAGPSGRAYARWTSPVDPLRGWLASATRSTVPAHSGMTLTRRGAKWFVTEVIAGSPAAKAGFLRGDEVLATTSHPDGELVGRAEATLRRRRFAGEAPVDVKIVPTTESWTSLVAAELAKAPTLINSGNQRVAVLKWPELTDESLRAPAFAALGRARDQGRAIVLDLRGERGFGGVTWLEPFLGTPGDDQAPAGSSLPSSEAGASLAPAAAAAHWALHIAQPMVAVVDGTTHGGRELLARVLARSGRARLVGRETAGRVAPEKVHARPSGSVLVLATPAPVGLDLRPVAPDEVVEDNLAYAAGRDPLLEHAVQVAAAAAEASSAAKAGASPRRQGH